MRLYIFVLRRPIKVPAPIEAIKPRGGDSFDQLQLRWQKCEDGWGALLSDNTFDHRRALFTHPLGGWFNLSQTVQFVIEHLKHHHFQLTRIESAIRLYQRA